MLKVGDKAPNFKLNDKDGNAVSLNDKSLYCHLKIYPIGHGMR